MIYLISTFVFSSVILSLVGLLLLVEAKIVKKGNCEIVINDDESKTIPTIVGSTLLSALMENDIFIPSACGGGGTCGTCKCRVDQGGGGVLPTELAHLNRKEKINHIRLACQLKVKEDLNIHIPQELLNVKKYQATVISNDNVASFIKELVLKIDPEEPFEFNAGAYIQIDIPEYELSFSELRVRVSERFRPAWDRFNLWGLQSKTEEPVFRAYSLASPPAEKNILRFTIRIATPPSDVATAPPGAGSSYIFNLQKGDQVTLSGPYGDFFVKGSQREMCFLGGGAGMAPLKSQILHQLNTLNTTRKISFWYGARSKLELFFSDEFKVLEDKFKNFSFHVALSKPESEDNWDGMTGYIHQCLYDNYLKTHNDPTEIEYYLCGPPMMVDAATEMLDSQGVEPEMIAFDKFS
ncbi:MAG: NADH:ubiquinone reductase (Na(+)-transporting) subunit F [Deltaproteobacteria bacterium]|nr:NADH:ubiquinone reductase (Na(+)-transporting) subunit F [Deltaproteobacteria bacterium]